MNYLTQIQGHTLWRPGLSAQAIVVDLGANRGEFSRQIISTYGCKSYAFEANPVLAERIVGTNNLTVFNYAVAREHGKLRFRIAANDEESTIERDPTMVSRDIIEVPSVHLEKFLQSQSIPRIDVLKMDIEGAEIEVLESCSDEFLTHIGQASIEFHDFLGMTPPEAIDRTVKRFNSLGFACIKIWQHAWGDALFINTKYFPRSLPQILWAKYLTRNLWGIQRVVSRSLCRPQYASTK